MSKKKPPATTTSPAGKFLLGILILLVLAVAGIFLIKRSQGPAPLPPSDTESMASGGSAESVPASPAEAKEPPAKAVFTKLVGRWLREDGGYVLELSQVAPDGKLTAAYFNPNPIHVSQAQAVQEGGGVKVGIELNDVNYPGCLYTLVFNPELDQLQGTYFQAAMGQTYSVAFVRMPAE